MSNFRHPCACCGKVRQDKMLYLRDMPIGVETPIAGVKLLTELWVCRDNEECRKAAFSKEAEISAWLKELTAVAGVSP